MRGPSLLPEWSDGHVLTHLARNADSVVRRMEGAARGELVDQYPGGLGLGLGPVSLPPALVEAWLPRELPLLAGRSDTAALLTWVIGRGPRRRWRPVESPRSR